jgi:hypothetical protein
VIVELDTDTLPADAVVYPFAEPVVDGADQPLGTSSVTAPFVSPPVAAVYVNVIVCPAVPARTVEVPLVSVPAPSAELFTSTVGDDESAVSVPAATDFCFALHVCVPRVVVAVAPGPPPLVAPYVIVSVWLPPSVTPETVIVDAATETVPVPAVV